jgi:ribosomal protein S18 acetylase RimI-like enzyme
MVAAPTGLVIRNAMASDAEEIHGGLLRIARHLKATGKVTSTPDDLRKYGFGTDPAFHVLIAEVDGTFAGMCLWFASFSTWRGRPGGYVQDIVVDEGFRGQAIGEALLRAAARAIKARGGTYLRLSVDAKNISAQRFYHRLGLDWSIEERIHAAYGDAFDHLAADGGDPSREG